MTCFWLRNSEKKNYYALLSKGLIMLCPGFIYIRLHVRKYNEQIERKKQRKRQE